VDYNLNWIYIAISWVLLRWHDLWSFALGPSSGWGWVLSIVSLVITIRVLLFPVFVKQIKSQRKMQDLQPRVKALQEKYKGDRETLQREMMELYRAEKANPLMGCLPLFAQIPVFIGLFHVLRLINPTDAKAQAAMTGEYYWSNAQFTAAANAKVFGVPIAAAFKDTAERLTQLDATSGTAVKIVAGILIATMVATTYITQRQLISRNKKTGQMADPQQQMIQRLMLYGVPASLLFSGGIFPIGVVVYWVTTNMFSMGQQFWVIKNMPTPGTPAKAETVKAVAGDENRVSVPRPGAKPVNPKKAARPATGDGAATGDVDLTKGRTAGGSTAAGKEAAGSATNGKAGLNGSSAETAAPKPAKSPQARKKPAPAGATRSGAGRNRPSGSRKGKR
jgi:YidC/Oxa1 family membrane protein insertase